MANGQGAASALPVAALFLKKVYADASLGYDPEESFTIPQELSTEWSEVQDFLVDSKEIVFDEEALNP
jgi:penicillin-binding protein 1A